MISARTIIYPGEKLLGGNICKDMNMEQITKVFAIAIEMIYNNQSLDDLDLTAFGIKCPPEDKGKLLSAILETILNGQLELNKKLQQVQNFFNNVQTSVGTITDEKVKVTKDSTASKYLSDAIGGTAGRVSVTGDKIMITGLTPIGTRLFISPKRKEDFDTTGKGKAGTDLEGWAIRNGNNGLDNALGRIPMATDTLDNAGKKEGANSFSVKMENIETFTLTVGGTITESLSNDIKARTKIGKLNKRFGAGGARDVLVPDDTGYFKESEAMNLKHGHSHNLSVAHNNASLKQITIIPEHIKEIPIEYIG